MAELDDLTKPWEGTVKTIPPPPLEEN